MSLKLYHFPPSRSVRVAWAIHELGLDAEIITAPMNHAALREPAYLKLNPLGKTPVIFEDDKPIIESIAIIEYLANRYGNGQLTRNSTDSDYADYLQWLHFGEAGMGSYVNMLVAHTAILPEHQRDPGMAAWAKKETAKTLAFIENHLGEDGYLLSDFSLGDISVAYLLFLIKITGNGDLLPPKTAAYFKRIAQRPAWKKASAMPA